MNPTLSIFPKFFKDLSLDELAELVREVDLDTTNAVVRNGFWVEADNAAAALPRFVKEMASREIQVRFCTWADPPRTFVDEPDRLGIMADSGITAFRMGYFQPGDDPNAAIRDARDTLPRLAALCEKHGLKAVYQVHHNTLMASPSSMYLLIRDLPPEHLGIMVDPGNQLFEGYERPDRTAALLGPHLAAAGIKDACLSRDESKRAEPRKGWSRRWCPLMEGETDWHAFLKPLHDRDFSGTFVFMPFYSEHDPALMRRLLKQEVAYLRRAIADIAAAANAPAK